MSGNDEDGRRSNELHIFIDGNSEKRSNKFSPSVPLSVRRQEALIRQMESPKMEETSLSAPITPSRKRLPMVLRRNERGETALHISARKGDYEQCRYLLDEGADVNALDYAGWSPLHEACGSNQFLVAQLLISRGADVNSCKNEAKDTALHDAVVGGCEQLVKLLLKCGADRNLANSRGMTPIDLSQKGSNIWNFLCHVQQTKPIKAEDKSSEHLHLPDTNRRTHLYSSGASKSAKIRYEGKTNQSVDIGDSEGTKRKKEGGAISIGRAHIAHGASSSKRLDFGSCAGNVVEDMADYYTHGMGSEEKIVKDVYEFRDELSDEDDNNLKSLNPLIETNIGENDDVEMKEHNDEEEDKRVSPIRICLRNLEQKEEASDDSGSESPESFEEYDDDSSEVSPSNEDDNGMTVVEEDREDSTSPLDDGQGPSNNVEDDHMEPEEKTEEDESKRITRSRLRREARDPPMKRKQSARLLTTRKRILIQEDNSPKPSSSGTGDDEMEKDNDDKYESPDLNNMTKFQRIAYDIYRGNPTRTHLTLRNYIMKKWELETQQKISVPDRAPPPAEETYNINMNADEFDEEMEKSVPDHEVCPKDCPAELISLWHTLEEERFQFRRRNEVTNMRLKVSLEENQRRVAEHRWRQEHGDHTPTHSVMKLLVDKNIHNPGVLIQSEKDEEVSTIEDMIEKKNKQIESAHYMQTLTASTLTNRQVAEWKFLCKKKNTPEIIYTTEIERFVPDLKNMVKRVEVEL